MLLFVAGFLAAVVPSAIVLAWMLWNARDEMPAPHRVIPFEPRFRRRAVPAPQFPTSTIRSKPS
jgi:hypothetical protein